MWRTRTKSKYEYYVFSVVLTASMCYETGNKSAVAKSVHISEIKIEDTSSLFKGFSCCWCSKHLGKILDINSGH